MNKKEWLTKCNRWKKKWPLYISDYECDKNGINLYTFMEELNKAMSAKLTIVCDAGSAIYVPCQNLKLKKKQVFILSGAQADMGFAVPAAIGVSLADKTKTVAVITGDGSFNTNIQELAVIKNLNLPVIIFVWNNNGYLSIKNTQSKFYGGRVYGTDTKTGLWFPDLKKVANTYEMSYIKLKRNSDFKKNISSILNTTVPMICEIICKEDQQIVPTLMLKKDKITGKNIQPSLQDMYPFLPTEELEQEMIH
jgi:acetolactate synthase-1/2/3 large subunit